MKFNQIAAILSTLSLTALSSALTAGNLTEINASTLPDNQKVVKIKFDKDVILPTGFVTDSPNRVVLDFEGTGIALPKKELIYNDPLLKKISAIHADNKTRLLLSLNQSSQYQAHLRDNNEVWIYFNPKTSQSIAASTITPTLPPKPSAPTAIANKPTVASLTSTVISSTPASINPSSQVVAIKPISIDFRKGPNNAGIISINLNGFQGKPEIKRQGNRLVLLYKGSVLPTEQQRNLDVTDFSTAVRSIELRRTSNGSDTQLSLLMQGPAWDYKQAKQGDTETITIGQQTELSAPGLDTPKNFNGRRISLDFQDIDVRTILQILAKESGMNIVASDSVQGKMTISLKNVPWDQALNLVMDARNLDMRRQGNIINVAPREELLARDKSTLQAQHEIDTLGPLQSQTFQLKYKNVSEFKTILRINDDGSASDNNKNSILSDRGSALIDPATNTLIITDIPSVIKKFDTLIAQLDVPAQQVMVEARIVEAGDAFARSLGVKFGLFKSNARTQVASSYNDAVNNLNVFHGGTTSSGDSTFQFNPNINLPVTAASNSIGIIRNFASVALGLELSASQAEGTSKIISSPRVLTQNRQEAVIESGTEVPYQEASSSGATSTSFRKAVLGLTVTPQIVPDGNIILDVKINKDSVDPTCGSNSYTSNTNTPCISTKKLNTKAMVENGGTLVIGGIYEENNSNTANKVPLLGDIPVIGNLFKYQNRSQSRKELLIFITPRIMNSTGSSLRY